MMMIIIIIHEARIPCNDEWRHRGPW